MPRIYLPITHIKEGRILITGEKARYLATVLRCRKGDELIVFDGEGNCLRTNLLKVDRKELVAEVQEKFTYDTESPIDVILVQALLKGQRMDMVIQKATELGVKEIIPVITERSQPRKTMKVTRWRKIAEEASRQSGRNVVPIVHAPMNFNDYASSLTLHPSPHFKGIIFYEEGGIKISEAVEMIRSSLENTVQDLSSNNPPLSPFTKGINPPTPPFNKEGLGGITEKGDNVGNVSVIIGPEGGFTRKEVAIAEGKGFIVASLGKRILRAETAAISAITLIQFLLGDLG